MLNKFSIGSVRVVALAALFTLIAGLGYSNLKLSGEVDRWEEQVRTSGANLGNLALAAYEDKDAKENASRAVRAEHRAMSNLLDPNGSQYPSGLSIEVILLLLGIGGLASFGLWHVGRKEHELVDANKILNRRLMEISTSISKHLPGGPINAAELGQDLPDEAMELLKAFEDYAKKLSEAHNQVKKSLSESEASRKTMRQELEDTKENLEICKNVVQDCINTITTASGSISSHADEVCSKITAKIEDMSDLKEHADKIIKTYQEVISRFERSSALNSKSVEHALLAQEKIESLKDAATSMGSVVDVITRIAEHTNHLALNATIEAARAGEAGKGFNVVATEVKDLSTQTSDEMKKISAQIVDIQNATGQSVAAIEDVVQTTKEVSDLAMMNSENPVDEETIKSVKKIAESAIEISSVQHYRDQIIRSTEKIDTAMKNAADMTKSVK